MAEALARPDTGCYQLIIEIESDVIMEIGALGECFFTRGRYVYTGSAMKNLRRRVARHLRREKKRHWHIDHLLADPRAAIIETYLYPSSDRQECLYNRLLLDLGAAAPVPRFGSSDCADCPAHLLKIEGGIKFPLRLRVERNYRQGAKARRKQG